METTEAESVSEGYEIINTDRDTTNLKADVHGLTSERRSGSPDSGVPLNCGETFLANRVRELQKENDELRRAIQEHNEALQMCLSNIHTWNEKQITNQKDLVEKHGKAEKKVRQLQDEKATLKREYEEQIKMLKIAAENTKVNAKFSIQHSDKLECLEKENASLKLMKSAVKTNVGSLHEHVRQILNLSNGDSQKLVPLGSTFLQDLVKVCKKVEESVDLVAIQAGNDLPSVQAKENANAYQQNIITKLQEELQNVKAKCIGLEETLEEERIKHSMLEKLNKELQEEKQSGSHHDKNPADVKELEKEVHLMNMAKSHGSEGAQESFLFLSQGRQLESVGSTASSDYEEEKRGFKKQIETLQHEKAMIDKELTTSIDHWETALQDKEALENQLKTIEGEKASMEEELQDMTAKYQTLEKEIEEKNDNDMVEKLVESQREKEKGHKLVEDKLRREITVLKAQICTFDIELEGKEKENDKLLHQGLGMQERNQCLVLALAKKEEDLRLNESALLETKNELKTVYGQNEKLLANQQYRGTSGAEVAEYKSKIDSLTAQLLGAEEMVENKEQDYRKLQRDHANLTSELETVPLLKQQIEVFQTDFETERLARQKREEDCKRLREELAKVRNENDVLIEEANDPTGSRMAEMQRRHGSIATHAPNILEEGQNSWSGFYDRFLAPRGPPGRSNVAPHRHLDSDLDRQVSGGRCPRCDRMFPDLDTLQIHVVECLESENTSSSGEKVCPKCQKSFPDLDTLQIHVMECLDN